MNAFERKQALLSYFEAELNFTFEWGQLLPDISVIVPHRAFRVHQALKSVAVFTPQHVL